MAEALGQREIFCIAGQRVNIGEHLVHAAVLGAEHPLKLGVGHVLGRGDSPVGRVSRARRSAAALPQ